MGLVGLVSGYHNVGSREGVIERRSSPDALIRSVPPGREDDRAGRRFGRTGAAVPSGPRPHDGAGLRHGARQSGARQYTPSRSKAASAVVDEAPEVVTSLPRHPAVARVSDPGRTDDPRHALAQFYCPEGAGAVFTFALKGGYNAAVALVIHPASTTHRQLTGDQRVTAGWDPVRCVCRSASRIPPTSIRPWRRGPEAGPARRAGTGAARPCPGPPWRRTGAAAQPRAARPAAAS